VLNLYAGSTCASLTRASVAARLHKRYAPSGPFSFFVVVLAGDHARLVLN